MAGSAIDICLKIDDVKGGSGVDGHKGEIDCVSWSWGASQAGSAHVGGGAGSTGKAQFSDLVVTKHTDPSTPVLLGMLASGKPFQKAVLTCTKPGGKRGPFLKITMEKGIISSHNFSGSDTHVETLSLNFAKYTIEHADQKDDGSMGPAVTHGFDITANKTS
jgi:type VI secretion system secreted protein Hcp